jgi:hypothetical protein
MVCRKGIGGCVMKANELRIGNWVSNYIGTQCKVEEWSFNNSYKFGLSAYSIDRSEPIPLTEEWLIKFGFEKLAPKGSIFKLGEFHVQNFYPIGFYECRNHIKIEHIHQLQNIYFALTGEELSL